jgi:GNAT superfamily N-acetyltransferase
VGNVQFQLSARNNEQTVISQKKTSTGGVSFVWVPWKREVMDVRIYVGSQFHGEGYGFLLITFVKAFFFAHRTDSMPQGDFALPLGGVRGVNALTVLPVTGQARNFYTRQGFTPDPLRLRNKWLFLPQNASDSFALEPERLDCEAVLAALFRLC